MRVTVCRHKIHHRDAQGNWVSEIISQYFLNEPEDGEKFYRIRNNKRKEVTFRRCKTFFDPYSKERTIKPIGNFVGMLTEVIRQEFDSRGRLVYSLTKGDGLTEECAILYDDSRETSIAHSYWHFDNPDKNDKYVVTMFHGDTCLENAYSCTTGKLLRTVFVSNSGYNITSLEFLPDGTVLEWSKEPASEIQQNRNAI